MVDLGEIDYAIGQENCEPCKVIFVLGGVMGKPFLDMFKELLTGVDRFLRVVEAVDVLAGLVDVHFLWGIGNLLLY